MSLPSRLLTRGVLAAAAASTAVLAMRRRRAAAVTAGPFLLEVTPPRDPTPGPGAVENLLASLSLRGGFALELAGAHGEGPRFLARAPDAPSADHLARQLAAQYPQGLVCSLPDPAGDPARLHQGENATCMELYLSAPVYLPLRTYRDLDAREGNDPLLGVLGALGTLPAGVRVVCQLALWPAGKDWAADLGTLLTPTSARVARAKAAEAGAGTIPLPLVGLAAAGVLCAKAYQFVRAGDPLHLMMLIVGCLVLVPLMLWTADVLRPAAPPDPLLVREKIAHQGFIGRLRLLAVGGTAVDRQMALAAVAAAYGPFNLPGGNSLIGSSTKATDLVRPRPGGGLRRWLGRTRDLLLNAREAAGLWHLPTLAADVPGLPRGGARAILPSHRALVPAESVGAHASGLGAGIALGVARAGGRSVEVALSRDHLLRNTAVVGASGTGKSTYLLQIARGILEDPDCGLLVLDPHGALAPTLLGLLPPARAAEAVYLSVADTEHPFGLNLLDVHGGRTTTQIVSGLLEAFHHHWEGSWGSRMDNVFRASLRTLVLANRTRAPGAQYTLLDVEPLLLDEDFRLDVLLSVRDRVLHRYWLWDYVQHRQDFRDEMIQPVLNKVQRFASEDVLRNIVCQRETTVRLARAIEARAPILVDTNAPLAGAENAGLFGAVLLDQVASLLRERGVGRSRLVVIVDEFQLTPADWALYLEGLRKFGCSFILATQSLTSLERQRPGLRGAVFGNLGTLVCFQVGAEDARYLARELDEVVQPVDLTNLPVRHAYVKTWSEGQRLATFWVEVPLPPAGDLALAERVRAASAGTYGRPRAVVEKEYQAYVRQMLLPRPPVAASSTAPGGTPAGAGTPATEPGAPAGGEGKRKRDRHRNRHGVRGVPAEHRSPLPGVPDKGAARDRPQAEGRAAPDRLAAARRALLAPLEDE